MIRNPPINETKIICTGMWIIFIIAMSLVYKGWYDDEQLNKGKSISIYLRDNLGQDVPPAEARWLEINANTYMVTIKDMEIFAK